MSRELQFLLLLAIIIAVSKIAGDLSRRVLRQPMVFGEILAGLLLGPSLLNLFGWPVFSGSVEFLRDQTHLLAKLGVILLMFIAGLETDIGQMRRVGKAACWTAIWGVMLPLLIGAAVARAFGLSLATSLFIGAVLTATSVSISAQTLMEIGQLRAKEGMTILGAAVIDDVIGIIVLSFVIAFSAPGAIGEAGLAAGIAGVHPAPLVHILVVIVLMAVFFALAVLLGKYFRPLLAAAHRLHASHPMAATAVVLLLLYAVGAQYLGQVADITGAYLCGVLLGRTPFREQLEHAVHPLTYALFVPVFFMSIGLGTDVRVLGTGSLLFVLAIVAVAILSKIIGCGLGARQCGFTWRESTRVGLGMISRGEVGLIVAQVGLDHGLLSPPVYAAMIIMVLASTLVTPLFLRLAFPRTSEMPGEVFETVIAPETMEDPDEPGVVNPQM